MHISYFSLHNITGGESDVQDTIISAHEYLQECYINSRHSLTVDEWPPYQPKDYATLTLIRNRGKCTDATIISVTRELAVSGKFETNLKGIDLLSPIDSISRTSLIYSNTNKNISDIFVSVTGNDGVTANPCIFLIEGASGMGKTMLAKEIAFQWANNKLLTNIKILFLLFLREINFKRIISVESLVQYVIKSSDITAGLVKYLLKAQGKNLAIVVDGYDEISEEDRKNSIIADIIHRRVFAKCCLVITSRPTASSNLHNIVDHRIDILGFTEEDRLDYIQTALQGNDDKIEALIFYLQSNPTINALCYIPLNLSILLCLIEDGIDMLPKTQTDMYKKFIEMTILRFTQKTSAKVSTVTASIARLPFPHNRVFEEVIQLSYTALKMDKIVFTMDEIDEACPHLTMTGNWNGLGLLKAVKYFNAKEGKDLVTFHFLHFSIQEYMAAWYISTLSNDTQIQLLKETFWQHRYYNTWIMYVGITCGVSFALKHFLSGHWFQITTKWFKTSSISHKYLKNKIKSLHLFQCLVESNNKKMIASVSQSFEGNKIDLSNQTLLPSDVNTLGFFLTRSMNEQWELLNLSCCNIGPTGINILCDRFLDKDKCHIVNIKNVNFSYNQLNFSSLIQLFKLFRSWHTSEIIVTDNKILKNNPSSELYGAVENAFAFCEHDTQAKLQFGSFYFAHGINIESHLYNSFDFKSVYLLNCVCEWTTGHGYGARKIIAEILKKQKFDRLHLINSSVPNYFMEGVCISLFNDTARTVRDININKGENVLFIYNPALSDEVVNEMDKMISSKTIYGVVLIISKSKVQGIINMVNLSSKLSHLEILNLIANIRIICLKQMQSYPWRQDLYCNGSRRDLIIHTFIGLLYRIACGHHICHLRIALQEKDTLIAHNVNYYALENVLIANRKIRAIYLNDCYIPSGKYEILCDHATKVFIFNGHLDESAFEIFSTKSSNKEVFIHSVCDIDTEALIPNYPQQSSILFVTKNTLVGCKPTTEQIMLALQLEPSIHVLKLYDCQRNFEISNQIVMTLATSAKNWTELDLTNSSIGEVECENLYRYLITNTCLSTIKTLKLPLENLTTSILPKLINTILMWKVRDLIFCGINHKFFKHFIKNIWINDNISCEEIFFSVTYSRRKYLFCNSNWRGITSAPKIASVYFTSCSLFSRQFENIIELDHIFQISIINLSFHENVLQQSKMLCISYNIQLKELDISDYNLQVTGAIMISKILQRTSTLIKLNISKNKITDKAAGDITAAISCNTQLQELDISDNDFQATGVKIISKTLQSISTLTKLNISKNKITDKAANDIAAAISCNTQLQELDISDNYFRATGAKIISKTLQSISTLRKLKVSKNNITYKAAEDIAAAISCNTQLQELDISDNDFQTTGVKIISKTLQGISTLTKLCIKKNNITDKAVYDIAAAISRNTQLQELDISDNNFQATGASIISEALQGISTLKILNICKNNITDNVAYDIEATISCKTQLQELDISDNDFRSTGIRIISEGLQRISTLTKLNISKNKITEKAAYVIAAAISSNTQLQELDISDNDLQAKGTIKILKALQGISSLTILYMRKNSITDNVADDIAAAISCNTQLQELDISNNCFKTSGAIKITKALQQILSLKKLYINNNMIMSSASNDIAAVFLSNTRLQEFNFAANHFTIQETYKLYADCKSLNSKTIILF